MKRTRYEWKRGGTIALAAALLLALGASAARAQEDYDPDPPSPAEEPSSFDTLMDRSDSGNVAQAAMMRYHAGVREVDRARKLERKAAEEQDEGKRKKLEQKSESAYKSAIGEFTAAIQNSPKLLKAYNMLGRTYLELGQAVESAQVHSAALRVDPQDPENLEGRAEALLALNYLKDAIEAYTSLLESDRGKADQLMAAMKRWLDEKRQDPGDLQPEVLEAMASWIAAQEAAG